MGAQYISWPDLCEVIGTDAARALCAVCGGDCVYVPKNPKFGELPAIIGETVMRELSAYAGGSTLRLPNEIRKHKPKKTQIVDMLRDGQTVTAIVRQVGVTDVWVRRLKAKGVHAQRQCRLPLE